MNVRQKQSVMKYFLTEQFIRIKEIKRKALLTSKPKIAIKPRVLLVMKFSRTPLNTKKNH